ncbi:hypothetical protein [Streptomyces sp. NPDC095613]|uniref:hypothetical protein n=1 Tax=Streptomyces sp. NPDC095613 TaxID=3155540 RepID=UPI0033259E91
MNAPDEAAAIEELLAPGGWTKLRREQPDTAAASKNLAIMMGDAVRDHIDKALKAAGESRGLVADEALEAYIDGTFHPVQPGLNFGSRRVALNVPLDPELHSAATEKIQREKGPRGYRPSLGMIVAAWILQKYPMDAAEKRDEAWTERHDPRHAEVIAWVKDAGADGFTVAAARKRLAELYPDETQPPAQKIQLWYSSHPNITRPSRGHYVWSDTPAE